MISNKFKEKVILITSSEGAKQFLEEKGIGSLTAEEKDHLLEVLISGRRDTRDFTPPARWAHEGKSDPHGSLYSGEDRNRLCMGYLTDDELANAVFLLGDDRSDILGGIGILTAGKERIRWLSRRVTMLEEKLEKQKA